MIGRSLGHYDITGHLGTGGMGEVYQAVDPKLGRNVAIKLLPEAFARDPERVARFDREARVLASLNHPNIAAIYGVEESGALRFLVMELVEGETLAERIKRGPIPVGESLAIAKQIIQALEAAHERSVVHRDLKPANVKITPDGVVKVLDFGLAKTRAVEPSAATLSDSPTLVSLATETGALLGTAAYMSPEQAKGRQVDGRTDIFAFGCVLYEMLTAARAFQGEDLAEILAQVLTREPDWTRLPVDASPRIRELLRLCLEKNIRNRRSSATDVRLDIEQGLAGAGAVEGSAPTPQKRPLWMWPVAGVVGAALLILSVRHLSEAPLPTPPELRPQIETPFAESNPMDFALSPDGRRLVFVSSSGGSPRLWLRALDKTEAQPMQGTDGAAFPFWSADSRSIGFFTSSKLYKIDIAGGPPQALANAPNARGGAWNSDGVILFGQSGQDRGISRVKATGGDSAAVTHVRERQSNHRFPQFLPDGRHFLFYAPGAAGAAGIYLASIDGGEPKFLTAADTAGMYLAPDRIAFVKQGALIARRLDIDRGELTGDAVTLADSVDNSGNQGGFSVSAGGMVAYRSASASRQMAWFDRTGKRLGVVRDPESSELGYPELSPGGRRLSVVRNIQGNYDIWFRDVAGGSFQKFTSDPAVDLMHVWSPDGKQIAFSSNRTGSYKLYLKASTGEGSETMLADASGQVDDWSQDGRFLLYAASDDLWALPMSGEDRKPFVAVSTSGADTMGQFSPDHRFVVFQTNESGRWEVVLQQFPQPGGTWSISSPFGGAQPRWRADGKEIYFVSPDGKMMAAAIHTNGASVEVETPTLLFTTHVVNNTTLIAKQQYAVSSDGLFLIIEPAEGFVIPPITLILNWKP